MSNVALFFAEGVKDALTCRGHTVARWGAVPGAEHAADSSCTRVAASLDRLYLSGRFPDPQEQTGELSLDGTVVAEVQVTWSVCVPGLTEEGAPPSADLTQGAVKLAGDSLAVWRHVAWLLTQQSSWLDYQLGEAVAYTNGTEAGFRFTALLDLGPLCPAECQA